MVLCQLVLQTYYCKEMQQWRRSWFWVELLNCIIFLCWALCYACNNTQVARVSSTHVCIRGALPCDVVLQNISSIINLHEEVQHWYYVAIGSSILSPTFSLHCGNKPLNCIVTCTLCWYNVWLLLSLCTCTWYYYMYVILCTDMCRIKTTTFWAL